MLQKWLNYFEQNRKNRNPVPWEKGIRVELHLAGPLVRSLQKFQLGESGEGHTIKRHARDTGDPAYVGAIDLFIKEEQEHARLMGKILDELNAPRLTSDWSDWCFVTMRRLFGLHQELMVLLLPEMIAKRYFRTLHDGTRDPVLKAVFLQIAEDEDGHLAFHTEYLRDAFKKMSFSKRMLAMVIWRVVYRATCLVVMLDHWPVLRAVGVRPRQFWDDCGEVFDEVATGIFSPAHLLVPLKWEEPQSKSV